MEQLTPVVHRWLYVALRGEQVPGAPLGKFGTSLAGGSLLPRAFRHGRGMWMHVVPWHAQSSVLPNVCLWEHISPCHCSAPSPALRGLSLCQHSWVRFLRSDDQKSALRGWQSKTPSLGWHLHLKGRMPVSGTLLISQPPSLKSAGCLLSVLNLGLRALLPATCIWLEASPNCPLLGCSGEPLNSGTNRRARRPTVISVPLPPVPGNSPGSQQTL